MAQLSIGEAIQAFLKARQNHRLRTGVQALQIETVWEQLMGKVIAKYTDKIEIAGGKLFVTTSVAALKNELLYQKATIIQRVNEALGEKAVNDVIIK
jgi:predicted nucleic acid-binding Zn ribbon protein